MPRCPLNEVALEYLVGEVAARWQQGEPKEQLVAEICAGEWAAPEEVTAFVEEVAARTEELGRAPQGCALLRQSAGLQARSGMLFAAAGGVAAGGSLAVPEGQLAILVVGTLLVLYGLALFARAQWRLVRYRR